MYEHKPDAHELNQAALDKIDRTLNEPVITIEESLDQALACGRISQQEHDDCLECYERTFLKGKEIYG